MGVTYELWKKLMATPASIHYAIFDAKVLKDKAKRHHNK
jgi:hypothetical protein